MFYEVKQMLWHPSPIIYQRCTLPCVCRADDKRRSIEQNFTIQPPLYLGDAMGSVLLNEEGVRVAQTMWACGAWKTLLTSTLPFSTQAPLWTPSFHHQSDYCGWNRWCLKVSSVFPKSVIYPFLFLYSKAKGEKNPIIWWKLRPLCRSPSSTFDYSNNIR